MVKAAVYYFIEECYLRISFSTDSTRQTLSTHSVSPTPQNPESTPTTESLPYSYPNHSQHTSNSPQSQTPWDRHMTASNPYTQTHSHTDCISIHYPFVYTPSNRPWKMNTLDSRRFVWEPHLSDKKCIRKMIGGRFCNWLNMRGMSLSSSSCCSTSRRCSDCSAKGRYCWIWKSKLSCRRRKCLKTSVMRMPKCWEVVYIGCSFSVIRCLNFYYSPFPQIYTPSNLHCYSTPQTNSYPPKPSTSSSKTLKSCLTKRYRVWWCLSIRICTSLSHCFAVKLSHPVRMRFLLRSMEPTGKMFCLLCLTCKIAGFVRSMGPCGSCQTLGFMTRKGATACRLFNPPYQRWTKNSLTAYWPSTHINKPRHQQLSKYTHHLIQPIKKNSQQCSLSLRSWKVCAMFDWWTCWRLYSKGRWSMFRWGWLWWRKGAILWGQNLS